MRLAAFDFGVSSDAECIATEEHSTEATAVVQEHEWMGYMLPQARKRGWQRVLGWSLSLGLRAAAMDERAFTSMELVGNLLHSMFLEER